MGKLKCIVHRCSSSHCAVMSVAASRIETRVSRLNEGYQELRRETDYFGMHGAFVVEVGS
jgi:hypothetical protein